MRGRLSSGPLPRTVYISLYKYFGAGTGAVLAGPKTVIEKVGHARKLFGGGLLHAWSYTAVALHFAQGFLDRFRKAVGVARALFDALGQHSGFRVEEIKDGTNIYRLHVPTEDLAQYARNLKKHDILLAPPRKGAGALLLVVNESLNRRSAEELARAFVAALSSQ
jgi:threonine aldolase